MSLAEKVNKIFVDCLFKPEECPGDKPPEGAVLVHGIVHNFGFHAERIKSHEKEIREVLALMPKQFHKSVGGGWSFLNLCNTESGEQWGQHQNMEELVCLGIGLGLVSYCMPREFWSSFPGGVPYIMIDLG